MNTSVNTTNMPTNTPPIEIPSDLYQLGRSFVNASYGKGCERSFLACALDARKLRALVVFRTRVREATCVFATAFPKGSAVLGDLPKIVQYAVASVVVQIEKGEPVELPEARPETQELRLVETLVLAARNAAAMLLLGRKDDKELLRFASKLAKASAEQVCRDVQDGREPETKSSLNLDVCLLVLCLLPHEEPALAVFPVEEQAARVSPSLQDIQDKAWDMQDKAWDALNDKEREVLTARLGNLFKPYDPGSTTSPKKENP